MVSFVTIQYNQRFQFHSSYKYCILISFHSSILPLLSFMDVPTQNQIRVKITGHPPMTSCEPQMLELVSELEVIVCVGVGEGVASIHSVCLLTNSSTIFSSIS